MNTKMRFKSFGTGLAAAAVASVLAACASTSLRPAAGAVDARARLTQLQSDPALANRAPLAMQAADDAVRVAERPGADSNLETYRVYMADRKIDIARAEAETRLAEDQRPELRAESEKARLDARTRELDLSQNQTALANSEGADHAAELQRQIDSLQGRAAGSSLVVTLGDSLFSDDGTVAENGSSGDLNRLVAFLDRYPDRTVSIAGYTDNTGADDDDQARSQRSADSVMSYLIGQGISPERLTASGMGDSSPVATNDSAYGRQQNRRVEVTIHAAESVER
jgi:outer membrane protein OmpA-like peptidoglycan-associated protein